MNSRQKQVLAAVVDTYTETAVPVGSQMLLEHYDFRVSSATLRNDMVALEAEEYLYQPHISAGRIPTDKGYRFYVEEVMGENDLSKSEQRELQKELLQLRAKHARLGRSTTKLLSALSGNLAVSGVLDREEFYDFGMKALIEKPEFQELDDLSRLVETLDTLDVKLEQVLEKLTDNQTHIFIGDENPIREISNCSMVVAPYHTDDGTGVLAIIGPKRMDYAKNRSLVEYMRKLLSAGGASLLIVAVPAAHIILIA